MYWITKNVIDIFHIFSVFIHIIHLKSYLFILKGYSSNLIFHFRNFGDRLIKKKKKVKIDAAEDISTFQFSVWLKLQECWILQFP